MGFSSFELVKARKRLFNIGDKVLILPPILGASLQAKYSGIEMKISDVDYVASTPGEMIVISTWSNCTKLETLNHREP